MKITRNIVVFTFLILTLSGCENDNNSITGEWAINLAATIQNAKSSGASEADVQGVKNTYQDGMLKISKEEIILSISGISGEIRHPYTITSSEGDCYILNIDNQPRSYTYCTNRGQLVINDPSTPLVAVYDKQ